MSEVTTLSAHDYRLRISALIERRRFSHARQMLGEALASYPDSGDLLYESALLDYMTDDYASAADTLQRVLQDDPTHVRARYLLVGVHEQREELPEAEAMLLDLLRDHPEDADLYARYAMLMFRTLKLDKAKLLAREALRLDPDNEQALSACMISDIIDGRQDAQRVTLAEMMRKHPEDLGTARLLIVHLIERGKYWSAKRIAIEILKAQPDSVQALTLVVELETLCHWTMVPLWPFNRWGFAATAAFYVLSLALFNVLRQQAAQFSGAASIALLTYVIYSWVYPPLLKRWLKHRAGL